MKTEAVFTREWRPSWPVDLGLTLGPHRRGSGDPAYAVSPDGAVWRATTTPDGPGTLRVAAARRRHRGAGLGPGGVMAAGGPARAARRGRRPGVVRAGARDPAHRRRTLRALPGRAEPQRLRGPGAGRAGAEGRGQGGLAGLALPRTRVRRGRAGAGAAALRWPLRVPPPPRVWVDDPVLGVAPARGSRPYAPVRSSAPRGWRAAWRSPTPPRPTGGCVPCRASGCGRRPRYASGPSATPTRCRSATTTSPASSAGR